MTPPTLTDVGEPAHVAQDTVTENEPHAGIASSSTLYVKSALAVVEKTFE